MLNVAVCGLGWWGRIVVPLIGTSRKLRVACVVDPDPKAAAFAAEQGVALKSFEEALRDPAVRGVVLCTPHTLHTGQVIAAASAKKHVFCEKPMSLSVADCDCMIAACEQNGVRLMVGHAMRLMPPMRTLRALVASGELGRPLHGVAHYWFSGFSQRDSGIWHVSRAKCGGLFYQMGIHQIDLFHSVFGPTRRVQYTGGRYGSQIEDFDDVANVMLDYQSGATGLISVSGIAPASHTAMTFIFSEGYVKCEGPWSRLEYGRDREHCTVLEPEQFDKPGAVDLELSSFVAWVLHDTPPVLTAAEGRAAIAVAEAADRARDTGGPVEVSI